MKHHALRAAIVAALLLVGAGIALAIVGQRVEHQLTRRSLPPAQVAPTISCPGTRATMNCVLQNTAPPVHTAKAIHQPTPGAALTLTSPGQTTSSASESAGAASIYGVDFGWDGLSALALTQIHARFAASYLSPDISKNWTAAAVAADHAAGIATVAVWEATATRAEDGYDAGVADARQASAQAAALGNTSETIDFAVDCDCAVSAVAPYFRGVHAVLGDRAGIYGGYDQVAGIHQLGLVGDHNWQTYAWSGGRFLPATIAPLEQYLNGSLYDNDRAIASSYGQWPAAAPPRPVNHRHWDWLPDTRRAFHVDGKTVHARERLAVRSWDRLSCREPVRRPRCVELHRHLELLAGRDRYVATHTGRHLRHAARRPRWGAVHYRAHGHTTTLGGAFRQLHRRLIKPGVVTAW